MDRSRMARLGALALGAAGLAWGFKAGVILAKGDQPALAFELGQVLFPTGILGIVSTIKRPSRLARSGIALAIVGVVGSVLALGYPMLPGVYVPQGDAFVLPYSLFVLAASLGGFLALVIVGLAVLRDGQSWGRWRRVPIVVGLSPVMFAALGAVDIELPILGIAAGWILLGAALWSVARSTGRAVG